MKIMYIGRLITMSSSAPKMMEVWNLLIKVSEMKPPTTDSRKVVPIKLVKVLAAVGRSKYSLNMK